MKRGHHRPWISSPRCGRRPGGTFQYDLGWVRECGDLFDEEDTGKDKGLLDELLFLVEGRSSGTRSQKFEGDILSLGDVDMLVTDQADFESGSGDMGEADDTSETLILMGIVPSWSLMVSVKFLTFFSLRIDVRSSAIWALVMLLLILP